MDIALKKVKHRVVESMNSDTADALGLSRAILCNDLLLKKLNRLENSGNLYKKLIRHLTALLNSYYRVARSQKGIYHYTLLFIFINLHKIYIKFKNVRA